MFFCEINAFVGKKPIAVSFGKGETKMIAEGNAFIALVKEISNRGLFIEEVKVMTLISKDVCH